MKGGGAAGGDKPGRSGVSPSLLRRMESKGSFRILPIAAGCFLFFIVFLLSSHHDAIVLHTLRPRSSTATTPAAATTIIADGEAAPVAEDDVARQDKSLQTAAAVQSTSLPHKQPVYQTRKPLCDFSDPRTDFCDVAGDIRIDANATAFVVVDNPAGGVDVPTTYKLRPYARKGDVTAMGRVTEITLRTTTPANSAAAPRCTSTHASPAVVFSAGGYAGNLFHDFTDLLVPLYNTAARYRREVHLVVSDANPRWLARYGTVLHGLSRHPPIHLAAATGEVHCFRHAVVGLRAYGRGELVIDRDRSVDGLSTPDFTRFLRRALSLPRDAPTPRHAARPRLLIVSRRGTRLLLNADAVARAAEEVGFEASTSELHDDVASYMERVVNAFDAVVGVHGAGLTNMVYLPPGAAAVQIVPWGGLRWVARMDFGEPAEAMGLRYIQYEVAVDESSLKDMYPRDHEVFTNPTALHKRGFKFIRQTFLNGQNITVDIHRFKPVLIQAFNSLPL